MGNPLRFYKKYNTIEKACLVKIFAELENILSYVMCNEERLNFMNDQTQEMTEYIKFWVKFSQKSEEIMHEYNNLSDVNKRKASAEAQRIFMAQGVAGVMEYGRNMALKNIYKQ